MKVSTLILTTTSLSLLTSALPTNTNTNPNIAPLSKPQDHTKVIGDNYIVVLKKEVGLQGVQAHLKVVGEQDGMTPLLFTSSTGETSPAPNSGISKIYQPTTHGSVGFYGYAGAFSPSTLEAIRASEEVDYVEVDQIVTVDPGLSPIKPLESLLTDVGSGSSIQGNTEKFFLDSQSQSIITATNITHQSSSPWGLARISHRPHLSFGTFTRYDYAQSGEEQGGVDVYVIDTGVNVGHVEFEGRARWGVTIPDGSKDFDGNGHGSHCAGTIGSRKYGVAKNVNIIAVKVLSDSGSGTLSDVVSGIQWAADQASLKAAAAQAEFAATGKTSYLGSVGSMSLGGGKSQSTDDAVNAATAYLHMAVAAGNDNKDACGYSPARAKKALTVGASTLGDERAYFSNFGTCVDILAPGLNILSVWTGGNQTTNTISGTSMATPHMAGLIAYLLSVYGSETLPFMSDKELAKLEILGADSGKLGLADVSDLDVTLAAAEKASISEIDPATTSPSSTGSIVYANLYTFLPRLAQKFIPTPSILSTIAPTPKKPTNQTLTPAQMKGVLKMLASRNMLTDMPEGTPNLLAFNNATVPPPSKKLF